MASDAKTGDRVKFASRIGYGVGTLVGYVGLFNMRPMAVVELDMANGHQLRILVNQDSVLDEGARACWEGSVHETPELADYFAKRGT